MTTIDFLHYDSDKRIGGRRFAWELLSPRMSADATVIFDDIQDNAHFRDLVTASGRPYRIFEFEGKLLGLIGGPLAERDTVGR